MNIHSKYVRRGSPHSLPTGSLPWPSYAKGLKGGAFSVHVQKESSEQEARPALATKLCSLGLSLRDATLSCLHAGGTHRIKNYVILMASRTEVRMSTEQHQYALR